MLLQNSDSGKVTALESIFGASRAGSLSLVAAKLTFSTVQILVISTPQPDGPAKGAVLANLKQSPS